MVEALCLELLLEVVEVPVPFISKSNTTTDKKNIQVNKKHRVCTKEKGEYPLVVEALCLELLLEVVEAPIPFISKSNTTTDNKTYM